MKHIFPSLLLLAALPAGAPAQDLVRQIVPADSQFVLSVDLGAVLDFVGRDLVRTAVEDVVKAEAGGRLKDNWLEIFAREWGFDPLTDLHGVVLFGNQRSRDGASLAVVTSARIDGLIERLTDMGALEASEAGGGILQLVPGKLAAALGVDAGEEGQEPQGYLYVHKVGSRGEQARRALVFGEDRKSVAAAQKAIQRGADTGHEAHHALRPGGLVALEVDGRMAELIGDHPAAKLTSKARRLSLQLSGADGALELSLRIDTETVKDARQIAALVNGLKALAAMVEPKDLEVPEELMDMVHEAQAKAEGKAVTLAVTLPRALVEQGLHQLRAELHGEPGGGHGIRRHRDAEAEEDMDEMPPVKTKAKGKPKTPARKSADR